MKIRSKREKAKSAELTKLNMKKVDDVKKFNMPKILKPWSHVSVFKRLKRILPREIKQTYAVRKPNGKLFYNRRGNKKGR